MDKLPKPEEIANPGGRDTFGIAAASVWSDPDLSVTDKAVWQMLDLRAGRGGTVWDYSVKDLADGLGISKRTAERALRTLRDRGLVAREWSGTHVITLVRNPARTVRPSAMGGGPSATGDGTSATGGGPSATAMGKLHNNKQQEARNKQASTTGTGSDPLAVEELLLLLPSRIRPEAEPHVTAVIEEALARGWQPKALAAEIARKITNPEATPALTVNVLRKVAKTPPAEHYAPRPPAAAEQPASDRSMTNTSPPPDPVDPATASEYVARIRAGWKAADLENGRRTRRAQPEDPVTAGDTLADLLEGITHP